MSYAIGVDLGGTNLRIAAVSAQGEMLEKVTTATKASLGRAAVLVDMTDAIKQVVASVGRSRRLLGIGVGVPGIIDASTGILRESPNLPGWNDVPLAHEIEALLGSPVILENDANAAALGEAWLGGGRGAPSMCMITLGTGVGGGIVFRGRVWQGTSGLAGELGHITVDPSGPKCGCGNYGCVEQFASATAVVRMAKQAIARGRAPELARAAANDPHFSALTVSNLATQGDRPAQEIFRKVGSALGLLLADLINTLNLGIYVIGGGVSKAWPLFAPAMFEEVQRRSFVYAATAPDELIAGRGRTGSNGVKPLRTSSRTVITLALLGSDAGSYGAARLAMRRTRPVGARLFPADLAARHSQSQSLGRN